MPAEQKLIKTCPFCGRKPQIARTKVCHDQLHGEPYQDFYLKCCMVITPTKQSVEEWYRSLESEDAMTSDKKLIEEMVTKAQIAYNRGGVKGQSQGWEVVAKEMLSVVKRNIGVVAMVCPECDGSGKVYDGRYLDDPDICAMCLGNGVVARTGGE